MKAIKQINNSDFEYYTVKLPLIFQKKKRTAYISKELEKNHPCFSDRCWWKSKIKYAGKSFVASIVVMDKIIFTRYKEENPGKILKFENKGKKIFFLEKEYVTLIYLTVLFSLLIVFFIFAGIKSNHKEEKETSPVIIEEQIQSSSENNESIVDTCQKIFSSVSANNGRILSINAGQNLLSINLCECFPEIINAQNIITSDLIFKNNIPYFSIQKSFEKSKEDLQKEITKSEDNANELKKVCHVKIRNLLISQKTKIISENMEEDSFEFETENLSPLLNRIREILKQNNRELIQINISNDSKNYCIKMRFGNKSNELNRLIPIITANEIVFTKHTVKQKNEQKELQKKENSWEIIGSITDKNEQYVFYKDSEGKIRRVKQ